MLFLFIYIFLSVVVAFPISTDTYDDIGKIIAMTIFWPIWVIKITARGFVEIFME